MNFLVILSCSSEKSCVNILNDTIKIYLKFIEWQSTLRNSSELVRKLTLKVERTVELLRRKLIQFEDYFHKYESLIKARGFSQKEDKLKYMYLSYLRVKIHALYQCSALNSKILGISEKLLFDWLADAMVLFSFKSKHIRNWNNRMLQLYKRPAVILEVTKGSILREHIEHSSQLDNPSFVLLARAPLNKSDTLRTRNNSTLIQNNLSGTNILNGSANSEQISGYKIKNIGNLTKNRPENNPTCLYQERVINPIKNAALIKTCNEVRQLKKEVQTCINKLIDKQVSLDELFDATRQMRENAALFNKNSLSLKNARGFKYYMTYLQYLVYLIFAIGVFVSFMLIMPNEKIKYYLKIIILVSIVAVTTLISSIMYYFLHSSDIFNPVTYLMS